MFKSLTVEKKAVLQLVCLFGILLCANALAGQGVVGYVCGEEDSREASLEPRVGLVFSPGEDHSDFLLSGFLISNSCFVSSGYAKYLTKYPAVYVSFKGNLPKNTLQEEVAQSSSYKVDIENSILVNGDSTTGENFSVLRLEKNAAGVYPGQAQDYFPISSQEEKRGEILSLIGFHHKNSENPIQKMRGSGPLLFSSTLTGRLFYQIDVTSGGMGGALLNSRNEAVGVHFGGHCDLASKNGVGNSNYGIRFSANPKIQAAIKQCLSLEVRK